MRGVGPGTVLGGRYAVHRRLEQVRDTERWSADDTTLGRRVSMLCIGADDHRTPALLDAARRAASVTHTVFVRILDVGDDAGVAYVVEEDLDEAHTLAELVNDGGVPGDEVRRITGEVAAALESARQRGMHHLDLKPEDVLRTPEGDIRLRGLETAAVRVGEDGAEPEDAARRDAVGVVALTYAGLTGLWPLGAGGSGLGAAPRVPGGVAAPSEIAAGVPRDLDAICRLTLNDDQGPTSPGDFARQVAPWPSRQVIGRPVTRSAPVAQPLVSPSLTQELPAAQEEPVEEPPTEVDEGDQATRVIPIPSDPPAWLDETHADDGRALDDGGGELDDDEHDGGGEHDDDEHDGDGEHDEHDHDGDPDGDDRSRPGATATAAMAGAGAAVAGAFGTMGERVGGLARRAVDKVSELTPDTATAARPAGGDLEAPAPLVPAEPLTRDESKLALGIVAGFLVLALVIGIWGVSRIGSNTDLGPDGPAAAPSRTATVAPSSATPSESGSAPVETGAPAEPLAILKVEAYDPEGDGQENNNLTPRTYDGDKSTGWSSENYRSDQFGGLKKGLGVIVDLGPNKKPQGVELDIPVTVDVEVYVGPDNRLEGATKIGEKDDARGTVTFQVPADVSGQYIVVWYTQLTSDDNGKRRAWLDEVVVTG